MKLQFPHGWFYRTYIVSQRQCNEWFQRFKNDDSDVKNEDQLKTIEFAIMLGEHMTHTNSKTKKH